MTAHPRLHRARCFAAGSGIVASPRLLVRALVLTAAPLPAHARLDAAKYMDRGVEGDRETDGREVGEHINAADGVPDSLLDGERSANAVPSAVFSRVSVSPASSAERGRAMGGRAQRDEARTRETAGYGDGRRTHAVADPGPILRAA